MFRIGAELNLDPVVWQTLEKACQKKRSISMVYFTAGRNAESERHLDPYVLHFARNNPYVTGWCHKNQAVRDFRVDRIRSISLLPDEFEVNAGFDRKAHFDRMFQHEVGVRCVRSRFGLMRGVRLISESDDGIRHRC